MLTDHKNTNTYLFYKTNYTVVYERKNIFNNYIHLNVQD